MSLRLSPAFALVASSVIACSASAGNSETTAGDTSPRLVFFMNPNGAPCQMQDRVLREMAPELNGRATLVYYRTTEQGDLPQFGRYGIRALPMLIVTDSTGREIRRATPGIHSADEIRQLLAL